VKGPLAGPTGEFLRGLAGLIGIRLMVYVPRDDDAAAVRLTADPAAAEDVDALVDLGRGLLATLPVTGDPPHDDRFATAVVRAVDDRPLAVVLAAKRPGAAWTEDERGLVRFATGFYAADLDPRAERRPPPAVDSSRTGPGLEARMRAAIESGRLTVAYQPEVDLLTDEIVGVEALVRWTDDDLGEVSPDAFIPVAERADLIGELGTWVLGEAVAELARWDRLLPGLDVGLRVNVSPLQLTPDAPDVVALLARALTAHDVTPGRVCIEITETAPHDAEAVARTVDGLRALGVQTALDDLATGYSTLSALRSLPVDVVKIDRSLVADLDTDARAAAIVTALIRLAGELGLRVVAEGVERAAEAEALRRLGCTRAQGHLFGRALPSRPAGEGSVLDALGARGRRSPAR
jgi:EAL domain-containing protein (putative c-di-GMP-specific phosphodiesterase class I)